MNMRVFYSNEDGTLWGNLVELVKFLQRTGMDIID